MTASPGPALSAAPAAPSVRTDHVRDGASACTVLLDDAHTRIEHFHRGGEGGTLVVTFDPILYLWDRPPFGHEFLRRQALDVVAVRKKTEHFYQPLSRAAFEAAVHPVAARYRRVVSYGSSLGAYAALYFGRDEPWTVIASSPRNSSHPVFGAPAWQAHTAFRHQRFAAGRPAACQAVIVYDPRDALDRRYIEGEVLPQFPHAQVLRVPFAGHPANQFLGDIGFIAPYVRAVLAEQPVPTLDRRADRVRSATYHQVLAQHCLQHGHLAWADALVERSLALAPGRMLALRTRGMVRLAQGRWDEAVTALEAARALSAEDPLTSSLLDRARQGASGATRPPPDARELVPAPAASQAPGRLATLWSRLRAAASAPARHRP